MARQRMIKPDFFESENIGACSIPARLLFIALWMQSNDYGIAKAGLSRMRRAAFGYDQMTDQDVLNLLCELEEVKCINGFSYDGEPYLCVPNFTTYQSIRKPNTNGYPDKPIDIREHSNFFATWRNSGISEALVLYEYRTSDAPTRTQSRTGTDKKKEGKKEVVVLQQQLPKEPTTSGADAGKPTPLVVGVICPECGAAMQRTNMRKSGTKQHYWRCTECTTEVCE